MADDDEIRGSRLRRAAMMTGTAAEVAAREAAARAMRFGGSDARRAAASRQQLKSADTLVKVLGNMRGAAMKVGQTLSAVDLGLVPEEIRPQFQEILAGLQHDAKPISFKAIRKVIEEDLEEKLGDTLTSSSRSRSRRRRSGRSTARRSTTAGSSRSRSSTPGSRTRSVRTCRTSASRCGC